MAPISEFQKSFSGFPLATYQAGQTVIAAGSKTGLLLVLKSGAVGIFKESVEIAKVSEPGSVFGEMSALLGTPHTVEVRAVEASQFHVADAALIMKDPNSLLHISTLLARRLDATNQALFELKRQLKDGHPTQMAETLNQIEGFLNTSNAAVPRKMRFFTNR